MIKIFKFLFKTTVMILLMIIGGISLTIHMLIIIATYFFEDLKDNIKELMNKDKHKEA